MYYIINRETEKLELHFSKEEYPKRNRKEKFMELQKINNTDITIKEHNGQRVVTFKDIDAVHGRPDGTAK